ncbi:MAG TPA: ATP-binding protein [Planctomycetota bacterium]|jgi:PAS domain S-box-containing protein
MTENNQPDEALQRENAEPWRKLQTATETFDAMRRSDALVVQAGSANQGGTMENADHPYRLFIEEMQEAAVMLGDSGAILFCNRRFEKMLQRAHDSLLGCALEDYVTPGSREVWRALLQQAKGTRATGEVGFRCKDGHTVPTFTTINAMHPQTAFTYYVLIADWTERKQHQAGRRLNATLKGVNGVLAAALTCQTSRDLAMACLRIAQKLTHSKFGVIGEISAKDLKDASINNTGRDGCAIIDSDGHSITLSDFKNQGLYSRVISEGKALSWNEPDKHTDRVGSPTGHPPLDSFLGVPLVFETHVMGILAVANRRCGYSKVEQTALETLAPAIVSAFTRKRIEDELKEQARRKDEFLAMLGHELRNPLAPIRNTVALMQRAGTLDPLLQHAREMIDRQVTHMARLIDDLLDVSRIARGKITLRKEEFDLTAVIRNAVADHRPLLEGNGLRFEFASTAETLWAWGDAARIAQLVSNLLVNANKFTDRGGLVSVELKLESEQNAVLTVRDTGIGMDYTTLERIFKPFAQADRSIDRSRGGLGLGLALVKGIVELHGGNVRATSAGLGHGSEFSIVLPMVSRRSREVRTVGQNQTQPVPRPKRIMIIEDNCDAAETLQVLLEQSGHTVAVAHSGPEGLERARSHKPEVILCDIGLPGMTGYEVAKAIRKSEELKSVYLVAMTGYGQDEDRACALEAGFDQHLTKPADPDALERLLSR